MVDDASTDGSDKIIQEIEDPRISILLQKTNQGYPVAMNAGIEHAQGKYIARMDADDICLPTRLEEQLEALSRFSDASLCGLNRFRITPGGKMYVGRNLPTQKYILETWEDLMQNRRLFTDPSVLVEKEKILAVGGYRTFQRSGMDVDLWLRIMERFGPVVTITIPLFGKSLEPGSIVFNPATSIINQIPRVLARQRISRGTDDVQDGKPVNTGEYIQRGWIAEDKKQSKTNLLLGALVTCLWLRDGRGVRTYGRYLFKQNSGDLVTKIKILWMVLQKLIQRMRKNPYKRFTIPV